MAGPDLSVVVAAIDYESVVAAVVGVAAAAMWVYVAWFGVKKLLAAVRGGSSYESDPDGFDPYEDYSYSEYVRDNRAASLPVLSEHEFRWQELRRRA